MKTPLYEHHVRDSARMVDFEGWSMPLHYGSQIAEHHAVRQHAGCFDVSHMGVVDVSGEDVTQFLQRVLVGDVSRLGRVGDALYTVLLNKHAGVVDDLIVYKMNEGFRLVINAATSKTDIEWMESNLGESKVQLSHRENLCIIAVQGPKAIGIVTEILNLTTLSELKSFTALVSEDLLVARTGYTGEDGVEIICNGTCAIEIWESLKKYDVLPAGLGARDSLRLEAGLNLYGHDMDATTSPLISNLAWTIHWVPDDRDFIGRSLLTKLKDAGLGLKLTGLVLEGKGVMREGCCVITGVGEGVVTSGSFSPTLGYSIGLARIPRAAKGTCEVVIRNRNVLARIVRPPFVRRGERVHK